MYSIRHVANPSSLITTARLWTVAAISVSFIALSPAPLHAEDLGQYGNQWNIDEPDGVDQITGKLREMEKSGKLRELQEKYRDDFIGRLENPEPVAGITPVVEARTYFVDPSVVLDQPIVDAQGKTIALPGTRINPLDYTRWSKSVVLIDARIPEQVAFAMQRLKTHSNDKIILTGGSYLDLMRQTETRVYYDLGGAFTRRFGITRVPAVVTQVGRQLEVREIALTPIPPQQAASNKGGENQ